MDSVEDSEPSAPNGPLKRLVKGSKRKMDAQDDDKVEQSGQRPMGAGEPPKRAKTGLKLKIKIGGSVVKGNTRITLINGAKTQMLAEVNKLGLPDHEWLPPAKPEWSALRNSPRDSPTSQDTLKPKKAPTLSGAKEVNLQEKVPVRGTEPMREHKPAETSDIPTKSQLPHRLPQPHPQQNSGKELECETVGKTLGKEAVAEPLQRHNKPFKVQKDNIPYTAAETAAKPATHQPSQQESQDVEARTAPGERLPSRADQTGAAGIVLVSNAGATASAHPSGNMMLDSGADGTSKEPPVEGGKDVDQREPERDTKKDAGKDTLKRDMPGHRVDVRSVQDAQVKEDSSSSDASSDTDSSSDSDSSRKQRRTRKRSRSRGRSVSRSRSREAGEYSEGEYRDVTRHCREVSRSRSRSREYHRSRSRPGYDTPHGQYRSRSRSREWRYDRHATDYRRDEGRRDRPRHEPRRIPSRYVGLKGEELKRKLKDLSGSPSPRRSSCAPSRQRDSLKRSSSRDLRAEGKGRERSSQERKPAPQKAEAMPPLPPDDSSVPQAPQPASFGFADMWRRLHGAAKDDWGTDADIDALSNAATSAKHNIENKAKATNGKHTFENLVALMRESYMKYMQVGAIWETMLRMPAQAPNRTRAKLADEGGWYPVTIQLMRQISSECKTCPANTEASTVLRILVERLMAIMQMRVVQVQRGKILQDRQLLLACKGAPKVDAHGRKLPGFDNQGETYQRPSPTDSNASNNTSDQAVAATQQQHVSGSPAPSRVSAAPRSPNPNPVGVKGSVPQASRMGRGAKVQQPAAAKPTHAKGDIARGKGRLPTPQPASGRTDAWSVEPLPWEIPPAKFEQEMRSWSLLGGVTSFTGAFRNHATEIEHLMKFDSANIKEAAGMLSFLDLGLGLSNVGSALQLSNSILDLVLKIQAPGPVPVNPPLPEG